MEITGDLSENGFGRVVLVETRLQSLKKKGRGKEIVLVRNELALMVTSQ